MMWILVVVLINGASVASTTAEFNTLGACTVAASQLKQNAEQANFAGKLITNCVKK